MPREVAQMLLRMLALAIRRVGEPHGRRRGIAGGTIIANVSPQPPGLRLAVAGSQHRNRRVVGMQLVAAEHVAAQRLDQRLHQAARCADPVGQRRVAPDRRLGAHRSRSGDSNGR